MKKLLLGVSLFIAGCTNFDQLVEQKCAAGKCGGGSDNDPVLTAEPAELTFSGLTGAPPVLQTVSVSNEGNEAASQLDVRVEGVNASKFSLSNRCPSELQPGDSCSIDVTFTATATPNQDTATLAVRANSGAPLFVTLSAHITESLTIAPASWDFGDVRIGETSQREFTAHNNATQSVTVGFVGDNAAFSLQNNTCSPVPANGDCQFRIAFSPSATPQVYAGQMTLQTGGSSQTLPLTGRGIVGNALQITPTSFFGAETGVDAGQPVGATVDLVFKVKNAGTQEVRNLAYTLTTTRGSYELLDGGACASLVPGAECTGVVRYTPLSFGYWDAQLTIDAGSFYGATITAPGRGVGLARWRVNVAAADSGTFIVQSHDGGRCWGICDYAVNADPLEEPSLTVYGADVFTDVTTRPTFLGSTSGCDGSICELKFTEAWVRASPLQDSQSLLVLQDVMPVLFRAVSPWGGNHGGLTKADEFCNAVARDAGLPGRYVAVLSTDAGLGVDRVPLFDAGWVSPSGAAVVVGANTPTTNIPVAPGYTASEYIWSYLGLSWGNCSEWTDAGSTSGSVVYNNQYITSYPCSAQISTACASVTRGSTLHYDSAIIFAAPTSGLRANFDAECRRAAAWVGLASDTARNYASLDAGACMVFADDADAGAAWLRRPLYRADGQQFAAPASRLTTCGQWSSSIAVGFEATDGGWANADGVKPVVTSTNTRNYSGYNYDVGANGLEAPGYNNCNSYTVTTNSSTFLGGRANSSGNTWWQTSSSYCDAPNKLIYCVARTP